MNWEYYLVDQRIVIEWYFHFEIWLLELPPHQIDSSFRYHPMLSQL